MYEGYSGVNRTSQAQPAYLMFRCFRDRYVPMWDKVFSRGTS